MDACTDRTLGGRYRLLSLLGRGGVADVYRAHDPVGGRDVAVKVFRPSCELIDAERRRRHEVEVLAALNHPGIVALFDADVSDESAAAGRAAFIVFELIEGPTLRKRIAQGPFDEHAVAALGARLAETLDHVHRRGIVHRDVKPANILLPHGPAAEHGAKLTDFGIARIVDSTRMTAEGLTVGTASYLSPEQVTSAPVGTASDVYSLGLVLIEALTGTVVYAGRGVETALRRLRTQPELPHDLNPLLAATLTAMTARDPVHRPSAREAARQLATVAEPSLVNEIMAMGAAERASPAIAGRRGVSGSDRRGRHAHRGWRGRHSGPGHTSGVPYDRDLAERLRAELEGAPGITEKAMFGGLAFLVDGRLAVAAGSGNGLLLRVDPQRVEDLLEHDVATRFVMNGRELANWLHIEVDGQMPVAELRQWIEFGVGYARSL